MLSRKIMLVNDHRALNELYRADLIQQLRSEGWSPLSMGIKTGLDILVLIFQSAKGMRFIASNLRSNLFSLVFLFGPGSLIVNGLGKWRSNRHCRRMFGFLLRHRPGVDVVIQCYADYRYFRSYFRRDVQWVCGSGGSVRYITSNNRFLLITRNGKIEAQEESLKSFFRLKKLSGANPLVVVGVDTLPDFMEIEGDSIMNVGRIPQQKILSGGSCLVIPDGYGDGFPQSACDALVSGGAIFLPKKLYVRFGLYKLHLTKVFSEGDWLYCKSNSESVKYFAVDDVSKRYIDCFGLSRCSFDDPYYGGTDL